MKKQLCLFVAVITLVFSGCYKGDIDDLKDDVNKLKEQMAKYESLLTAMNNRLYITSYTSENGKYNITLSDGTVLNVSDKPAFFSVSTTNTWLIDNVDTKVAVAATSPLITIGTTGNWFIDGKDAGIKSTITNPSAFGIVAIAQLKETMLFVFGDGKTIQLKSLSPEVKITVPAGGFNFDQFRWVRITPDVEYDDNATYTWTVGNDTIGTTKQLMHIFAAPGAYGVRLTVKNGIGQGFQEIVVTVKQKAYSNAVTKVFEYFPAPGQFINELPGYVEGDNAAAMALKAEKALSGNSMICLGGFGGYVVMGFDHTIINQPGKPSFLVKGNAFANWAEAGVISVSYDANGNGLPDDEWFEIAGSEYNNPRTVKNYTITYFKPDPNKNPTPNDEYPYLNDTTYIRWKDNQGKSGYLSKNSFHSQSYYPLWKGDSISFTGTKLTDATVYDKSGTGTYFVSEAFEFGYADNWSNTDEKAKIKLDWAVDKNGKPVKLKGIDFIKVHTGQRAEGGWLGEISTEVAGVTDLNL
ncbi:uncharacterized protein DUF4988 [Chitinophaga skermanii]|uniref:Uncharacterized protein DUF4988 n=1 Tax=Chitinophaga skermanii TaxID=331697 RepID=A0A327QKV8_9BACT|nr:PKD domain-containing protein [Chitinophaga skermanii]RAJ02387.1 uncharacterized protein DUF4988 [Chitinophaga skermanii]